MCLIKSIMMKNQNLHVKIFICILMYIAFILFIPISVASPVTIYGYATYQNGDNVTDAPVIVHADGYTNETTFVSNGFWQVDVGAETGTRWEEGTSFTVLIRKGSYEGTKTGVVQGTYTNVGTVIVKDSNIFQPVSDASKNDQNGSDHRRPVAIISESLYEATVNETIEFSAVESYDINGSISGYRWDFDGDGFVDTDWKKDYSITHKYAQPGLYSVVVQVKDMYNHTDADSAHVVISNETQRIDIKAKTKGLTGQTISFTLDLTDIQSLANVTWTIGDDTILYGQHVNHTFVTPGTYFVTVEALDGNDAVFYDIHRIEVKLDTDKDLLSNEVEELIGSSIWTKNAFITVQMGSEVHLLVNTDTDRFYDVFYNSTVKNYSVVRMEEMNYLIDSDIDGKIEYEYNESTGSFSVYHDDSESNGDGDQNGRVTDSPGVSFIVVMLLFFVMFFFMYIKKQY